MARSIKKGPFIEAKLLKRVEESNKTGQKQMIKTYSRDQDIFPQLHDYPGDGRFHHFRV